MGAKYDIYHDLFKYDIYHVMNDSNMIYMLDHVMTDSAIFNKHGRSREKGIGYIRLFILFNITIRITKTAFKLAV